jgi:hypothetical protein
MTEIETVTVTYEELKANVEHYHRLKDTKRLVVVRDGEEISVLGPWLPGERRRSMSSRYPLFWSQLLNEMFPEPWDPEDPSPGQRAIEEDRGRRPFTEMPPPSPSSS